MLERDAKAICRLTGAPIRLIFAGAWIAHAMPSFARAQANAMAEIAALTIQNFAAVAELVRKHEDRPVATAQGKTAEEAVANLLTKLKGD